MLRRPHWALNTTVRCQHRCVYCFEGERTNLRDVPVAQTRALMEQAVQRVPMVVFMGAEPTMNPDILALTRYGVELGLEVVYSTNALRFADRGFLQECREAGLHALEISFPYPDESVYAALANVKPKGFGRLLEALENIDALNRDLEASSDLPLAVNVNVVVSQFNVHRLGDVLEHVKARFVHTPYLVTLKGVTCPVGREAWFAEEIHVDLATLRWAFGALLADDGTAAGLHVRFRGLPLCGLPDPVLNADLEYLLHDEEVQCNFADQDVMQDMYPSTAAEVRHPYEWLCGLCNLSALCQSRETLCHSAPSLANRPVPFRGPVLPQVSSLLDGADAQAEGPPVAVEPAELRLLAEDEPAELRLLAEDEPAELRLLAELWETCPPGEAFSPDTNAVWEPVETGTVQVALGAEVVRLRVGLPREDWPARFWAAGAYAIAPLPRIADEQPQAPLAMVAGFCRWVSSLVAPSDRAGSDAWAHPGLALLSQAFGAGQERTDLTWPPPYGATWREGQLRSFSVSEPVPGATPSGEIQFVVEPVDRTAPRDACLRPQAGWLAPNADDQLRARLDQLRPWASRWHDAVSEVLCQRYREAAKRSPQTLLPHSGVVVGGLGDTLLLRLRAAGAVRACRVASPGVTATDGFLCGALQLRPHPELVRSTAGARCLQGLGRVCVGLQEETSAGWPDDQRPDPSPFLEALWQIFGAALLPSASLVPVLRGGTVSRSEVRLAFVQSDGDRVTLVFVPPQAHERCFASSDAIALYYEIDDGTEPDDKILRIVKAYAKRLAP